MYLKELNYTLNLVFKFTGRYLKAHGSLNTASLLVKAIKNCYVLALT